MDVRLLEQADIPQAKALWKQAFGDSDAFIDWYFANKALPGNSLCIFDGKLASIIHMIPVNVRIQGRLFESAYIAGAATAADRRGEGLMRTLLYESLRLMRERGITVTHLYPFRHSFYESFGWATYSYVYNRTAKEAPAQPGAEITEPEDWKPLAPLYERVMSRFDGYIARGSREWRWRFDEHMVDGGKTAALKRGGKTAAYMLYGSVRGKAEVIETVYEDERDIQPLLSYILGKGHSSADYFIPAGECAGAAPYGMARIVDARALLKAFGAEELLEHMSICDGFAEWNNIGSGEETDIRSLAKIMHRGICTDCINSVIPNPQYNILMKYFLPQSTCIFEQY
jgi:predicted acetyltransferase